MWVECLFLQSGFAIASSGLPGLSIAAEPISGYFLYSGVLRSTGTVISSREPL